MELDTLLQNDRTLFIIRSEDLRGLAENLAERINRQPVKEEIEKPIPQNEAEDFLGKSRQTFYTYRRKGLIHAHTLGGRNFYFKSELVNALKTK